MGRKVTGWQTRRRSFGFTLIELLVVFAIMALVVAVVPVAMDRMRDGAQYRDTVRATLDHLRAARSQAISHGDEVQFIVDMPQRRFGVKGIRNLSELPSNVQMKAVVAESVGDALPGVLTILFLPSGGSSGGSVEILREQGHGVRLRVDWLTGRVTQEALLP